MTNREKCDTIACIDKPTTMYDFKEDKTMMNIPALALLVPATGDNFPVIPIVIIGVIAVVLAIVMGVLSKKKK